MASALKNLMIVIIASVICLVGAWIYVRNSSLANPVQRPHDHPFLSGEFPALVAYGLVPPTAFPEKKADLKKWASLPKSTLVWLPISLSHDGDLQVKDMDGERRALADVLRLFPSQRLVLNFLDDRPDTVGRILKLIDESGAADRILIQSPIDRLLREVRKERPRWLFGTSQALMTRFKMMASIGLVAAVPIEGDVLVMEVLPKKLSDYPRAVIEEAHRRHLRVFAGPVSNEAEANELFALGADAVMTMETPVQQ